MIRVVAHVHSTHSFDGKVPLADVAALFRARGLDAVLLAEHIETLDAAAVRRVIDECRALSDERFLMLPGVEIEDFNLLVYGLEGAEPWPDLHGLVAQARRQGAFIALSHPAKLHAGALDVAEPVIEGVEVWNRKYDGRSAARPMSLQLYRTLRRAQPHLTAVAGLDFHRERDFAPIHMALDAERPARDEILGALRRGAVRIHGESGPIAIREDDPAAARALYRVKSAACATTFDAVHLAHAGIRRTGVTVPAPVRKWARWLF